MSDKNDSNGTKLPGARCQGQVELPTPEERRYLDEMRAIKEQVRGIKQRLREFKASTDDREADRIAELNRELDRLKTDWTVLENKRKAAVKERMICLGHEEPD